MSDQETRGPSRLADVAARAGVSIGTASKALNGQGGLRPQTRAKVLSAAEELGFLPNALARSLLRGRSFTVGLIASDVVGRFSIPVMLGVEDTLGAGRIAVLFCDGRGDPIREEHYLGSLLSRRVDGIIVAGGQTDPRPPIGRRIPVPVVYAWTPSTDPMDVSVVPDHEGGAYTAVRHLLGTGHQRVGHVTGPGSSVLSSCGPKAPSGPLARTVSNLRHPASFTATGARPGEGRPPPSSSAAALTSTLCSAATTRSPAASPTACATSAHGYRTTWRSSGSTTGRSCQPTRESRCRLWT